MPRTMSSLNIDSILSNFYIANEILIISNPFGYMVFPWMGIKRLEISTTLSLFFRLQDYSFQICEKAFLDLVPNKTDLDI